MVSLSRQAEIDRVLPTAVARLREAFGACRIYHFGSSAEGNAGPHSDLDLLVVLDASGDDFFERARRAARALRGIAVPIDVLVYTESEFEPRARRRFSLERAVVAHGRVVNAA